MMPTFPHICYSENSKPSGPQPQAQLQQRGFGNEEAAVESVGFNVTGFCCPAGLSQSQSVDFVNI